MGRDENIHAFGDGGTGLEPTELWYLSFASILIFTLYTEGPGSTAPRYGAWMLTPFR